MENRSFNSLIGKSISSIFRDALRISLRNPAQALFWVNALRKQKNAARTREKNEKLGLHVPPFMIASITHKCNLKCKGCYAQAQHKQHDSEMSAELLEKIVGEAQELGISFILLAGGEPLVRSKDILKITGKFQNIIFPIFTNGMLLSDDVINTIKLQKNIVPVVSIEGHQEDTDSRRGIGVYEHLKNTIKKMDKEGIFFGTSITLTRANYDTVTGESFIQELMQDGCKLFFFIEYVPVAEETDNWILTEDQRAGVPKLMDSLRNRFQSLFIAFPGDEEAFGGCLAAGRGFVHINPEGGLEPCPFAPFSDTSLKEKTLREALGSAFLETIRQNHGLLTEGQGGCALWEKRGLVKDLLDNKNNNVFL